jgi:hypothetical protein
VNAVTLAPSLKALSTVVVGRQPNHRARYRVLDLAGHPGTTPGLFLVLVSPIGGSIRSRLLAALDTEQIKSPTEAVRAAFFAEYRSQ